MTQTSARPNSAVATLVSIAGSAMARMVRSRPRPLKGRSVHRRLQRSGEVAAGPNLHPLQPEPSRHERQFGGEFGSDFRWRAGLGVGALDPQAAGRPVRLQVHPGDQPLAEQEGQDVVAVQPLLGRRVDLDAIAHAEQPLGARPFPHQRVEGRQQRARVAPARAARGGIEVGRLPPALDPHGNKLARLDQFRDPRFGVLRAEAKVVPEVARGRYAERAGCEAQEVTVRLRLAGRRPVQDVSGQDAFGQVVDPLEAGAAGGRADQTRPEQPFERALGVAPSPPAAGALRAL